ncbi:HlyD family secretion protein [Stappia indica]|uniref:HlyD family secretion protein n=1 Tax=Stappia indica TaxID=538381 RepID=UPI001CD4BEDC|nr:HlyD family efflux transporter periplasmic adaptor subunit [Stappia indica]MCA1300595.1 HlyD family efflux transporter periplasmic adaptor subunit [Stappia indica]
MSKTHWLILLVLSAALGLAGFFAWQHYAAPLLPEGIVSSNGRIEAERIDVSAKLPGRVAEVFVSEGQWVTAGTLVARLDTLEVDAQLHQAEAMVKQAEQQKLQSDALLKQREAELEFVKLEVTRTEQLAAKGHATQQQLDQLKTAQASAAAGVAAAEAGIDLGVATIASAKASVERLQSIKDDASLFAPRDGRVQYILTKAGEVVGAGGKVVTLTDLTDIYMTIFLPARNAGLLAVGAEARLILDPIPDYVVPAQVSFVASTAQFTPKSVETADERDQLMFRVKLSIPPSLLAKYQEQAKAGVAGVGYVRLDAKTDWPDWLQVKLPQ